MAQVLKLVIEVAFEREPSPNGQLDIKAAIQDLKESLGYLGTVTRADLVKITLPELRHPFQL